MTITLTPSEISQFIQVANTLQTTWSILIGLSLGSAIVCLIMGLCSPNDDRVYFIGSVLLVCLACLFLDPYQEAKLKVNNPIKYATIEKMTQLEQQKKTFQIPTQPVNVNTETWTVSPINPINPINPIKE